MVEKLSEVKGEKAARAGETLDHIGNCLIPNCWHNSFLNIWFPRQVTKCTDLQKKLETLHEKLIDIGAKIETTRVDPTEQKPLVSSRITAVDQ